MDRSLIPYLQMAPFSSLIDLSKMVSRGNIPMLSPSHHPNFRLGFVPYKPTIYPSNIVIFHSSFFFWGMIYPSKILIFHSFFFWYVYLSKLVISPRPTVGLPKANHQESAIDPPWSRGLRSDQAELAMWVG